MGRLVVLTLGIAIGVTAAVIVSAYALRGSVTTAAAPAPAEPAA